MTPLFQTNLDEHLGLFASLGNLVTAVEQSAQKIAQSLKTGSKLMLCGNGGSAADSQHIAAESTGRFIKDRPSLAAISLCRYVAIIFALKLRLLKSHLSV
jgi:D-sedoheptulose 7-phosphate isomerase